MSSFEGIKTIISLMLASYFKHVTTGALSNCAVALLDVASEGSEISAATEHFSGAELAGLVRSAGSFALASLRLHHPVSASASAFAVIRRRRHRHRRCLLLAVASVSPPPRLHLHLCPPPALQLP